MLRKFLRVVAGLVGICLTVPGSWAIIGISNHYASHSDEHWPLFDIVAMWSTTAAIWAASLSLIWFAAQKTRPRSTVRSNS
jgi:cytochrome bd-type quinol oxidase subunit 2